MKMICDVPEEVIKCIKDGTWCGSSVAEKMIANGIPLSSSENPNKSEIMTGWIPVSERLPEIYLDVLLSLRSLDVEVGFRGSTEPYYYCHGGYIDPQNVLAWQPLPEPYTAEGGEAE